MTAKCKHWTKSGQACKASTLNVCDSDCVPATTFCFEPVEPDDMMLTVAEANEAIKNRTANTVPTQADLVEASTKCRREGCHNYIHFEGPHRIISACTRCGDVKVTEVPTYEPPARKCPVCATEVI
jgi:hypothetical protein